MKHLLALLALTLTGYAQGLVNFYNTPNTLISDNHTGQPGGPYVPINWPVGAYEFVLLTSPVGANNFSFAGIYATNTTTPGMINGGSGVSVPGWAAGTARDYVVFGWAPSSVGVLYNSSWLNPDLSIPGTLSGRQLPPFFGLSSIGSGLAGGTTAGTTAPNLDLFGPSGVSSGFRIIPYAPVPEPSTIALLGLGAAVLLIRHQRGRTTPAKDAL